jgi:hypothetical protein
LGNLKGRDHFVDLGIDGRIILNWIVEKRWKGGDWIHLAQDGDRCRALVNTAMNVRVP